MFNLCPDLEKIVTSWLINAPYLTVEGIDGSGKGTIIRTFAEYIRNNQKKPVFDVDAFQIKYNRNPTIDNFKHAAAVIFSEPTFANEGAVLRNKLLKKGSNSDIFEISDYFSDDRTKLFYEVIRQARENGIAAFGSRSLFSQAYQIVQGEEAGLSREEIVNYYMKKEGSIIATNYKPNLTIIQCTNPIESKNRLGDREKEDDCMYENLPFQTKLEKVYLDWIIPYFTERGFNIRKINGDKPEEYTKQIATDIVKEFIKLE